MYFVKLEIPNIVKNMELKKIFIKTGFSFRNRSNEIILEKDQSLKKKNVENIDVISLSQYRLDAAGEFSRSFTETIYYVVKRRIRQWMKKN